MDSEPFFIYARLPLSVEMPVYLVMRHLGFDYKPQPALTSLNKMRRLHRKRPSAVASCLETNKDYVARIVQSL